MIQRYKRPDQKNALSIIEAAHRDMTFTLTLQINEQSAATIIRNIYESFRMLGDALLISEGKEAHDHIEAINELFKLKINTTRPLQLLENLRRLRHNINYYGYAPTLAEVEDIISFSQACFNPTLEAVKKHIKKEP